MPLEVVSTGALESIERAQIDTQIATAKKYPRNILAVKQQMLSIATLDDETAAACFYTLPRGGKTIQGPSVRMAEIALSCFGNVKAATRILSVATGENPHAVVQAVVCDMEKNVTFSVEKRRRITAKKGRDGARRPVDDDDIQLAVNAGSAIAFRDAVFKVVPGALIKSCFDAARKVAVGDLKSLIARRSQVLDRLKKMGAIEDRIFAAIGVKKAEEIDLDKLEELIGIGTALKDGSLSLEDAFPAPGSAEPGDTPRPMFRPQPTTSTAKAPSTEPVAKPDETEPQADPATTPKPAADPTPPPAAAPVETPQSFLANVITTAGLTFDQFVAWASASGFLEGQPASFEEIDAKVASRLLKSRTGMLNAIRSAGGAR